MKTASSRTKGNTPGPEQKREGKRIMMVFPFLLGIVTFAIDGMLSFYSFWNSGLGMTAPVAVGMTFASLAFAIFITVIVYIAIRDRY